MRAFVSSDCLALLVLTQLERLLPQPSAGYREERTGGVLTPPPAGGAEGGGGGGGGSPKAWGLKVGRGAGFGHLNGRYAQPIMGVGIHLGFLDSITH